MLEILKFIPKGKQRIQDNAAHCSFCSKGWQDVAPMVEGPNGIYICYQCIELCQAIVDQSRKLDEANKNATK